MAGMAGPGDRIEARCTRCNDVTGHVVVALVGGEIVKVECRACGSVHKYHPPVAAGKARETASVCRVKPGQDRRDAVSAAAPAGATLPGGEKSASRTGAASLSRGQRLAEEQEQSWQRALNTSAATPRPYAMDAAFAEGDIIDHPKFGLGVVREVLPPDKIQVLFRDGGRLLRCAV